MIVGKSSWLRLMVGECRAAEKAGAVGCKLLYPNQMVADDPFYNLHFSRAGGAYRELRVVPPDDVRRWPAPYLPAEGA